MLPLLNYSLPISLLTTFLSFLFFGRAHTTYQILLLSGLSISAISYLIILFGKRTPRSKGIWTLFVITFFALLWLTEPILICTSYQVHLNAHEEELLAINQLIMNKPSGFYPANEYTPAEMDKISLE